MTKPFKTLFILIFILSLLPQVSVACLSAYQFKMFPVGTHQNHIVSLDFKIRRTEGGMGVRRLGLELSEEERRGEFWFIYSYLAEYDSHQNLISLIPLDTTYAIGKDYSQALEKGFLQGQTQVAIRYPFLEYFEVEALSFCDFQQDCNWVSLEMDSITQVRYIRYQDQRYSTEIVKDSGYYGFNGSSYHPYDAGELYFNSVRKYSNSSVSLVVCHMATGHEIYMGWITSDPMAFEKSQNQRDSTFYEPLSLSKEYPPKTPIAQWEVATYAEPILHHGYGFDLFFEVVDP